jgi:hypothetical protein
MTTSFINLEELTQRTDVLDYYKQLKRKFISYMLCIKAMRNLLDSSDRTIIKKYIPKFKFGKNTTEAAYSNIVKKMKEVLEAKGITYEKDKLHSFIRCKD